MDTLNLQLHMEHFPLNKSRNQPNDVYTLGKQKNTHVEMDKKGWDALLP